MDKKDYKYILKRVITFFIIFFILLFLKSCNVKALEITNKIGGQAIGGNSYISVNTSGLTSNMNISYLYDLTDVNDYDFAIKYNLLSAPTGSGSNANKITYYFVLSYCSNVGASVTNIYNSNYNFIDANYNTTTVCYANGNVGSLFNAYIRMSPTSVNIGNSSVQVIYFNNVLQLQSRFTYNGYVGFTSFNILTPEEYQKAIDNRSILYQQQVLNDSINAMKNQAHTDSQNIQNAINDAKNQAHQDSQAIKDAMTDTSSPSNLDGLSQSAGWLPPGPVDSILNLPLSLLNNISDNLSKTCQPVILTIPYVNSTLTLPCLNTLYDQMGVGPLLSFIGTVASCFILLSYLIKLYKWVDDTLTFRENNHIDNWGGI